jgi:mevalonate kinase
MIQRCSLAHGLRIETHSSFSDELGLGSSAAVTTATIAAIAELMELRLPKAALFALGHEAVRSVQGVGSGFDLAASIYGGTLYYRRPHEATQEATRGLRCPTVEIAVMSAGPLPLVVGYSGEKADTTTLVHRVARRRKNKPALIGEIFDGMARLVEEGREALLTGDWPRLGQAMSLSQSLLDALGVSTPKLAHLVSVAVDAGAYGAKLSGAGGGDCMIALVGEEHRDEVTRAIEEAGGRVISLRTAAIGIRRENGRPTRVPDSMGLSHLLSR